MRYGQLPCRAWLPLLAALPLLASCASNDNYSEPKWQDYPKYDVDPQVIYRIDDHRYLLMDNYPDCNYVANYSNATGVPRVFYRDDKLGITKKLGTGVAYYQGKLIIDAPKGSTIAFPSAPFGACTKLEHGCADPGITYSTDAGRMWQQMPLGDGWDKGHFSPSGTARYRVTVTDAAIYISRDKLPFSTRFPIGADIRYFPKKIMPNNYQIQPNQPVSQGETPSKMDRLICDSSFSYRSVHYLKIDLLEYLNLP